MIRLLGLLCFVCPTGFAATASCQNANLAVHVLGSGGPIADDGRASTGYLVWNEGLARILIDAGSGTFVRYGESGADFEDLDFVGLSHYHTDHSGDVAALLKSGSFSSRARTLPVAGPGASDLFPGLKSYLFRMFDRHQGAYPYLAGFLDGSSGLPELQTVEVMPNSAEMRVFEGPDGLTIDVIPVPHGIVPALSYRVRKSDVSIVFGGDQNGSDDRFVQFANGADLLVMHMAVPEGIDGPASRLHATPDVIGRIARRARVETLVLSHIMARSARDLEGNVRRIREHYDGRVVVASDLLCLAAVQPSEHAQQWIPAADR